MKILSISSLRLARSSVLKFSTSPMAAPVAPVWSSLIMQKPPKPPLVCDCFARTHGEPFTNSHPAKFTGYQYGGRPLGITFVKYLNAGPRGDAMDGAEPAPGITQDQIM